MNIFLWILGILGAILGVILLLVIYLIFGRILLVADYRGGEIKLWLQFLFLKYTVYPDPEKQIERENASPNFSPDKPTSDNPASENPKEESCQAPSSTGKAPQRKRRKRTVRSVAKKEIRKALHTVGFKDYASLLQIIATRFIAKFRCEKLTLYASIGGEDAMTIATDYGTINAILYPILGAFSAAGKLKKCDVQITPDFTSQEIHGEGRAIFSFHLYQAFACIWELSEKLY